MKTKVKVLNFEGKGLGEGSIPIKFKQANLVQTFDGQGFAKYRSPKMMLDGAYKKATDFVYKDGVFLIHGKRRKAPAHFKFSLGYGDPPPIKGKTLVLKTLFDE